jgi:tetratricopeptide (TPR) repeat protein
VAAESEAMITARLRRRWLGLGIVAAVVLAGIGWRAASRSEIARASVPVRPELGAWPVEFVQRVAQSEAQARGWWRPAGGLAVLSRLYHANGFYNEALRCLAGLERLERGEARWPHLQAVILAEFGRLDDARPAFERVVARAPDYVPARLRFGDVCLKTNQTAAAVEAYAAVLTRAPNQPFALLGLAKAALAGGDWGKAREYLERAVAAHPDFIGGLSLLVTVREHFEDKSGADALRALIGKKEFTEMPDPWRDQLADDCYDPYLLSVAASKANFSGDTGAARRWLVRAIALAPQAAAYRRQLGKILLELRDYAAARPQLEKAVELEPGDSDAWALLVFLFSAMGDTVRGDQALAAGLARCPESAALHQTYGQRLGRAGRHREAIAELKLSQRLRPTEATAYIDLAMIYFREERLDDAVAELKGALAVQPGHPLAMGALARHAIGSGDEAAARHWIRQLREQSRVPAEDLQTIVAEYGRRFGRAPW